MRGGRIKRCEMSGAEVDGSGPGKKLKVDYSEEKQLTEPAAFLVRGDLLDGDRARMEIRCCCGTWAARRAGEDASFLTECTNSVHCLTNVFDMVKTYCILYNFFNRRP